MCPPESRNEPLSAVEEQDGEESERRETVSMSSTQLGIKVIGRDGTCTLGMRTAKGLNK